MSFATITAAQVCDAAIISFSALWLFLVVGGIVGSAIACWQDVSRKPLPVTAPSLAVIKEPVTAAPVTAVNVVEPQAASEAVTLTPGVEQEPQASQPTQATKRLTYAQQVKTEFTEFFKMPITTKADIRSAIINRSDVSFMQAVNLERTGNDFYRAAQDHLNRLKAAKQVRLERSA